MTGNKGIKIHWAWIVLGSSFATLFVTYGIRIGAYSILLPEMIKDLQITKTQAGMIKSAFSLTYLLFSPITGWLTDRFGGRRVISLFCLFLGGGTFFMGRAESLTASVLSYSIVGIGAAALWVPVAALIQNWFGAEKRGLALGLLSPSYAMGFGLMGLFLPWVVSHDGWRMGWSILGVAGLFLSLLNWICLRNRPEGIGLLPWGQSVHEERNPSFPSSSVGVLQILREGRFWILGFSYLAMAYGTYTVIDFLVTYGTMELKIPYSTSSFFMTVIALSGAFGGILFMAGSDYVERKTSLIAVLIMMALSVPFFIFGGTKLSLLMVGAAVLGFPYGAVWPMYAACVRDYFPKERSGTILGLLTIFYGLGAALSPTVTGFLADQTGTLRWPFGAGGLMTLLSAFLVTFFKKSAEPRNAEG